MLRSVCLRDSRLKVGVYEIQDSSFQVKLSKDGTWDEHEDEGSGYFQR